MIKDKVKEFHSRIAQAGPNDCWLWSGCRSNGYGFYVAGAFPSRLAHRIAYLLANGEMPKVVRHACDNPPCCNPAHLIGGDQAANVRDMLKRKRAGFQSGRDYFIRGDVHPNAVLNTERVLQIKRDLRAGNETKTQIARRFGVQLCTISAIAHGRLWKHVVLTEAEYYANRPDSRSKADG